MRDTFHADIDEVLEKLVVTAGDCDWMLRAAVGALNAPGAPGAEEVVARDNAIDLSYQEIQGRILGLFALQAPVARDLRLLAAMLHTNIHVERLGDYAAHVARMATLAVDLDADPGIARHLADMGEAACEVSHAAIRSLARGDVEAARGLPVLDDAVDAQNLNVFQRVVHLAARDEDRLEWATHMVVVARSLERYGDHAVDIGEQTLFAVTGEMVELSSNAPRIAAGDTR